MRINDIYLTLLAFLFFATPVHSIIFDLSDTDDASRKRADAYPSVGYLTTPTSLATTTLIHTTHDTLWCLSTEHCVGNFSKNKLGTKVTFEGYDPLCVLEVITPKHEGPRCISTFEREKDIALLRCARPEGFTVTPMSLFNPQTPLVYNTYDRLWKLTGDIVGYGYHGCHGRGLSIDYTKRHARTQFFGYAFDDFFGLSSYLPYASSDKNYCHFFTESAPSTIFASRFFWDARGVLGLDKVRAPAHHTHITIAYVEHQGQATPGDSGAPLIIQYKGKPYMIGMESYLDAQLGYIHTAYQPISYYYDWIQSHICKGKAAAYLPALSPASSAHAVDAVCPFVPIFSIYQSVLAHVSP